jgi:hypothetical protein
MIKQVNQHQKKEGVHESYNSFALVFLRPQSKLIKLKRFNEYSTAQGSKQKRDSSVQTGRINLPSNPFILTAGGNGSRLTNLTPFAPFLCQLNLIFAVLSNWPKKLCSTLFDTVLALMTYVIRKRLILNFQ